MAKHDRPGAAVTPQPAAGVNGEAVPAAKGGQRPPDMRMLTEAQKSQAQVLIMEKDLMFARKRALELESELLKVRQENLGLRAQIHNQASAKSDKTRDDFLASLGADPKADKVDLDGDKVVIHRGALKG